MGTPLIDPRPILVVTGMAREALLASGPATIVVASGGNSLQLRQLLAEHPRSDWRAILSFGIAGGLAPHVSPGDVVVSTGILAEGRHWPADKALVDWMCQRLSRSKIRTTRAVIAGIDAPMLEAALKAALHGRSGAAVVDMESHQAAEYAAERGLPFAALRVVCDPSWRTLPPLAATALNKEGGVDLPAVLSSLLRRPFQLAALPNVARDSVTAFRTLRRCRNLLGIGRGFPDLFELLGDVA